ncbi:DUF6152 family protein [Denitromonas iodatirespirans]|uniref:DNA-binding protein n=1 Tax=Denitromonas iodatirespirans TaxID=2795389 RepID=A0A944H5W5_DENI1|nr:DUF6152 family protein [Denitromonas iodatirespirans]MBT0959544.1 hypothetical protein [Denitromonas iodatirespirans]
MPTLSRTWLAALALLAGLVLASGAWAHHGWRWASDQEFELSGTITAVRLGNPHGELTLDADGERWEVEVGQPWRNQRAGLTEDLLRVGTRITAHGHRASDPARRVMKAERIVIDDKSYNLYPDRDS